MQAAPLLLLVAAASTAPSWAGEAFGIWKWKGVTLRIQPHTRGEVFTLDTVSADGRASTSSTILYFDGKARQFQDASCQGTQSSRRVDDRTIEILRECGNGDSTRLIRRLGAQPGKLILEIVEQRQDRRSERRLVLEKQ